MVSIWRELPYRFDPTLPVILISGRLLPGIDEMQRKDGFLPTPYRAETLLHIVADALT